MPWEFGSHPATKTRPHDIPALRQCQGKLFGALTGGGGVKIDIRLVPQQGQEQGIIPMDHYPSWKLHKNPFWRVKHPNGSKLASVAPVMSASGEIEVSPNLFAYESHQDIGGVVTLTVAPGKKVEHLGIKVQFIGRIDMVRWFRLISKKTGAAMISHSHNGSIL